VCLILSRKGYDSAAGGRPSPIFPDGDLCSLPIPSEDDLRLSDVRCRSGDLGEIAAQLTGQPSRATAHVHLDPDLDAAARPRPSGWRPCFGQTLAAQAHLDNQGVGVGDLFLFFGWFREVVQRDGEWRYRAGAPDIHCLFGWLQIAAVYRLDCGDEAPSWGPEHPHVKNAERYRSGSLRNTLYAAADRLELPGLAVEVAGGGVFPSYTPALRLTAPDCTRSTWRLPGCFAPRPDVAPLSFHGASWRWNRDGDDVLLKTAGRGQEFVLDCDDRPGMVDWLAPIFEQPDH